MSNPLEKYLREVAVELHTLPREEREDQIEEIRSHLMAYAEQQKAEGKPEEEACIAAIAQFGTAAKVSQGILQSARRPSRNVAGLIGVGITIMIFIMIGLVRFEFLPKSSLSQDWLFGGFRLAQVFATGVFTGLLFGKVPVKWIAWVALLVAFSSYPFWQLHVFQNPASILWFFATSSIITLAVVAGSWLGGALGDRLMGRRRRASA